MIGSGLGRSAKSAVQVFCQNHLGLMGLGLKEGELQLLIFVADGNFIEGINTDGDLGVTQGVSGTLGLNLVNGVSELERQVLGE